MGIGKRLKEAREIRGLTQKQLADFAGVTGSAITNYESETSHPKEAVLYKLISALDVDANYLFQDCVPLKDYVQSNGRVNRITLEKVEDKNEKAPTEAGEGKYKNIIDLLDKLNDVAPEKILKVEGYIESLIESAGADKQINGHTA